MECVKHERSLPSGITIRNAKVQDVENINKLLERVVPSWPRNHWYVESLLQQYPGCADVAETEDGEICGVAVGVPFSDTVGVFDTFVVREDLQRQGIGGALIHNRLKFLGNRNVLLNGTVAGSGMYVRRGFSMVNCELAMLSGKISEEWASGITEHVDGLSVADIKEANVTDLIEYDCNTQGMRNEWLFKHYLASSPAIVGKVGFKNGRIVGFAYALVSPSYVNPILTMYADSSAVARKLLSILYHAVGTQRTNNWDLVVPNSNAEGVKLVQQLKININEGPRLTPMYTKQPVAAAWDRIYSTHFIVYNVC